MLTEQFEDTSKFHKRYNELIEDAEAKILYAGFSYGYYKHKTKFIIQWYPMDEH